MEILEAEPYSDPSTTALLILGSLLVLLNALRIAFDHLVNAGLLGELALGIVYGTPLGHLLEPSLQQAIIHIGYVGLVLLVFQGGLTTDLNKARSNLGLAFCIAATGIVASIGLSILLLRFGFAYRLVEAFAAGVALSATSLGTTLTLLDTSSIANTRLATALISAAVIDDVIPLALLPLVVALGSVAGKGDHAAVGWQISRPIVASVGLLIVAAIATWWVFIPAEALLRRHLPARADVSVSLGILTIACFAGVSAAGYAGSSQLLGSYLAGFALACVDAGNRTPAASDGPASRAPELPLTATFARYVRPVLEYVLVPLFFASLGFALPVKQLFHGKIAWRGLIYALLMVIGKLVTGLWVPISQAWCRLYRSTRLQADAGITHETISSNEHKLASELGRAAQPTLVTVLPACEIAPVLDPPSTATSTDNSVPASSTPAPSESDSPLTRSNTTTILFPTLMLGFAMVVRGEIGLVISQVALNAGALTSETFLIAQWAVIVNTLVGAIAAGLLAKRAAAMPPEWA